MSALNVMKKRIVEGCGGPSGGWFHWGKKWSVSGMDPFLKRLPFWRKRYHATEAVHTGNTWECQQKPLLYYCIPGSICSKPEIYLHFPEVPNTLVTTWKYSQWLGYPGQQLHYVTALGGTYWIQLQRKTPWKEGETLVRIETTFP